MFFDVRRTGYSQLKNNYFGNMAEGSLLYRSNWGGSLDDVYIIDSANIINVRFNFTRLAEVHALPSSGFNPTTLGFPASIAANSEYLQLPRHQLQQQLGFPGARRHRRE